METRPPPQSSPLRLLYIVATLPFILAAILYFTGAFRQKSPAKPISPIPSPIPLAQPAAQSSSPPAATERIDTAPHHPPGKNAADFYKQAYGLCQQLDLTDAEHVILNDPLGGWQNDPSSKTLFAKIQPIIALLRQSEGAAYTDWGIHLQSNALKVPLKLPQSAAVTDLGKLITWNAAYEFQEEPSQALSDLKIEFAMGNSVGGDFAMGMELNIQTQANALALLQAKAEAIPANLLPQVMTLLQSDQLLANFSQSMTGTADLLKSFADAVAAGHQSFAEIGASEDDLQDYKNDPAAAIRSIKLVASELAQIGDKALMPEAQFESWWQSILQSAAGDRMATSGLEGLPQFRATVVSTLIKNSMLQAGLSILQTGDAALGKYPDPTTGQPFTLVPTADGFELQSTFQYHGKPVVMPFPTAKP